jgi:hypothetical protein
LLASLTQASLTQPRSHPSLICSTNAFDFRSDFVNSFFSVCEPVNRLILSTS